jgi:hypothetical protein
MLKTTSTPDAVLLGPREVAALPWPPFAGLSGLRDRVLWQDPAGKSLAGLLHLDPGASMLPHIHLRATHCSTCTRTRARPGRRPPHHPSGASHH